MTEICQSCAMPLDKPEVMGTEKDGEKNRDYCLYCYSEGVFAQECSLDGMIEHCLKFLEDFNRNSGRNLTHEEAKEEMKKFFPTLKRWQEKD